MGAALKGGRRAGWGAAVPLLVATLTLALVWRRQQEGRPPSPVGPPFVMQQRTQQRGDKQPSQPSELLSTEGPPGGATLAGGQVSAIWRTLTDFLERCDWLPDARHSPLPTISGVLGIKNHLTSASTGNTASGASQAGGGGGAAAAAAAGDGGGAAAAGGKQQGTVEQQQQQGAEEQQVQARSCIACSAQPQGATAAAVALDVKSVIAALHAVAAAGEAAGGGRVGRDLPCLACPAGDEGQACRRGAAAGRTKLRIGVLTVMGSARDPPKEDYIAPDYFKLSQANKLEYCQRHGYGCHVLPPLDHSRHPAWSKFASALALMPLYDWIWMVDADTLIMAPDIPLTQYIDEQYDLIATQDCNGLNTGSVLLRSSQWSEALLAAAYGRPNSWEEQGALAGLLAEVPGASSRAKILPNKGFNSYSAPVVECGSAWQAGDFLAHMPGMPDSAREGLFRSLWKRIPGVQLPNAMEAVLSLPPAPA